MHLSRELLALTQGIRGPIAGLVAIGLLLVAASLASLVFAGRAIGAVFAGRPFDEFVFFIGAAAVAALVRGGLLYVRETRGAAAAATVKQALRTRVYGHLLALGPGYLERHKTGELVASAVDGVEALETYYGKYLPQLAVTVLAPIGILAYLWSLDPPLAIVMAIFLPLALLAPWAFRKLTANRSSWHWRAYADFSALFLDSLQGLPTLKAFAQGKARGRAIASQAVALFRATMRILAINLWSTGLMDLAISGGAAAALAVGAVRAAEGYISISTLIVVMLLGAEVFRPVRELGRLHHQGLNGISAAQGIFALLASRPEVEEPANPSTAPLHEPAVRFERVTFGYDGGQRPALRGFDLHVAPGETVALVGSSGAGKSTVINLLLRYFDPQEGTVLLGGVNVREWALDRLRAQFATVSQDTYLFHGTVAENLRMARPGAAMATLEAASRAANAHDFITRLPLGYDTVVGDRGQRLSGGERQRIAIARALLKDAPILLLDEPTSSVDAENEELIQEAIRRLSDGRTTLLIAHRLSTVADADRIVVMAEGGVVESGRHEEMLRRDGAYARLVAAQQITEAETVLTTGGPA
jgi:ABC-type multidrug transport system fused ATPase/permease subunit